MLTLHHISIDQILDLANNRIIDILVELGVLEEDIRDYTQRVACPCPCHGGDNPTGFSYSLEIKHWICFTRNCNDGGGNVIDLVKLTLDITNEEAIEWLTKFLNIDGNTIYIPKPRIKKPEKPLIKLPLNIIKDKFKPSQYFLKLGFTEEILTKYMVTDCLTPSKKMYQRACAPILDESGESIVGATGRSLLEECSWCSLYHKQGFGCPHENPQIKGYPKWCHWGPIKRMMYNYSNAKPFIQDTKTIILTEGIKEVLFLEQNQIHNSCCLLGLRIYPLHWELMNQMGVETIVFGLDKDKAALEILEKQKKKLSNRFKIFDCNHILQENQDLDDLSIEDIEYKLKPFLDKINVQ